MKLCIKCALRQSCLNSLPHGHSLESHPLSPYSPLTPVLTPWASPAFWAISNSTQHISLPLSHDYFCFIIRYLYSDILRLKYICVDRYRSRIIFLKKINLLGLLLLLLLPLDLNVEESSLWYSYCCLRHSLEQEIFSVLMILENFTWKVCDESLAVHKVSYSLTQLFAFVSKPWNSEQEKC